MLDLIDNLVQHTKFLGPTPTWLPLWEILQSNLELSFEVDF